MAERRLRILTWHVHGNYLHYLSQCTHDFFIVTSSDPDAPRAGLGGSMPWGPNLHEVEATTLRQQQFDCILYQSRRDYEHDRLLWLSPAQRQLPQIALEHDPPRQHACDERHWADDARVLIVHVTHYNALMWNSGALATRVIEHGVVLPESVTYDGRLDAGIVVVNHLAQRGRRLGLDLFQEARLRVPLTLIGMGAEQLGGLGEVPNMAVPAFMAQYRLFYHPVRYTSLGLALIEAMHIGMPVVALATTAMPAVIHNGYNGFADARPERLIEVMQVLLRDPALARNWGQAAQRVAHERFGIGRFVADWHAAFAEVTA